MTNDEIRKLPVVNPDDLATQHVCVPVGDLARLLSDSDRATDGLLRFGSCSEEAARAHDVARRAAPNYRRARQWGED